ncbi:MAG TPA: POTRA domain-containing protein [Flavitalea sp.]|nr:POTRA domain-containing protein [Flavitalea sp.]
MLLTLFALSYAFRSEAQLPGPGEDHATGAQQMQQPVDFVIGEILISGNKRTKPYLIERELSFKKGDSVYLPELVQMFEKARQQLINTRLFNEVVVALKSFRGYEVDITIDVKERWYIFPIPYLRPVDRNLSEWAAHNFEFDRMNYGLKFMYYNFTGRNDKLKLWLLTGYTQKLQFQYEQPYADETLKHGYKIGGFYSSNKEVNYGAVNNRQMFTDSLGGIKQWHGFIEYDYRPALKTFHALRFGFTRQEVDSNIAKVNPGFFKHGMNKVDIPEISYKLSHFNVDYIPYPLTGWMGEVSLSKRGIHPHTSVWQFDAKYSKSIPLSRKNYFIWQTQGLIRFPFDQPYYNTQLFGYGDFFLRGLEKYVIDGVAGAMSRQAFRRELLRFSIPTFLNSPTHDRVPFRIYANAFTDIGFSYNKNPGGNSLANKMLYTAGAGIDVVTFYDFVFHIDYSFNQLGEKGLFLRLKNSF